MSEHGAGEPGGPEGQHRGRHRKEDLPELRLGPDDQDGLVRPSREQGGAFPPDMERGGSWREAESVAGTPEQPRGVRPTSDVEAARETLSQVDGPEIVPTSVEQGDERNDSGQARGRGEEDGHDGRAAKEWRYSHYKEVMGRARRELDAADDEVRRRLEYTIEPANYWGLRGGQEWTDQVETVLKMQDPRERLRYLLGLQEAATRLEHGDEESGRLLARSLGPAINKAWEQLLRTEEGGSRPPVEGGDRTGGNEQPQRLGMLRRLDDHLNNLGDGVADRLDKTYRRAAEIGLDTGERAAVGLARLADRSARVADRMGQAATRTAERAAEKIDLRLHGERDRSWLRTDIDEDREMSRRAVLALDAAHQEIDLRLRRQGSQIKKVIIGERLGLDDRNDAFLALCEELDVSEEPVLTLRTEADKDRASELPERPTKKLKKILTAPVTGPRRLIERLTRLEAMDDNSPVEEDVFVVPEQPELAVVVGRNPELTELKWAEVLVVPGGAFEQIEDGVVPKGKLAKYLQRARDGRTHMAVVGEGVLAVEDVLNGRGFTDGGGDEESNGQEDFDEPESQFRLASRPVSISQEQSPQPEPVRPQARWPEPSLNPALPRPPMPGTQFHPDRNPILAPPVLGADVRRRRQEEMLRIEMERWRDQQRHDNELLRQREEQQRLEQERREEQEQARRRLEAERQQHGHMRDLNDIARGVRSEHEQIRQQGALSEERFIDARGLPKSAPIGSELFLQSSMAAPSEEAKAAEPAATGGEMLHVPGGTDEVTSTAPEGSQGSSPDATATALQNSETTTEAPIRIDTDQHPGETVTGPVSAEERVGRYGRLLGQATRRREIFGLGDEMVEEGLLRRRPARSDRPEQPAQRYEPIEGSDISDGLYDRLLEADEGVSSYERLHRWAARGGAELADEVRDALRDEGAHDIEWTNELVDAVLRGSPGLRELDALTRQLVVADVIRAEELEQDERPEMHFARRPVRLISHDEYSESGVILRKIRAARRALRGQRQPRQSQEGQAEQG